MYEGSAASGMLGNAASRKIRAPVVNHLFPRLCVNNLVQSRAINKIAREISSTALLAVVVILVPTNGKKGQTKFGRNITYRDPIKDREKFCRGSNGNRSAEPSTPTDDDESDLIFLSLVR